jgi:hypothetical protein
MHGLYEPHFGLERTLPIMTPSIKSSFEVSALPACGSSLILSFLPHRPQMLVVERCAVSGGDGVHLELSQVLIEFRRSVQIGRGESC